MYESETRSPIPEGWREPLCITIVTMHNTPCQSLSNMFQRTSNKETMRQNREHEGGLSPQRIHTVDPKTKSAPRVGLSACLGFTVTLYIYLFGEYIAPVSLLRLVEEHSKLYKCQLTDSRMEVTILHEFMENHMAPPSTRKL
ncbi:hypothetical protein B0J17DRAFT_633679 [Rhizoctonia solani]|nr:hypothetical protein B0J17DRAFT_633679 [Rhizoctonia solani]